MAAQRVLVTGGADGIGLAVARGFVAAGHRVHICDVDGDGLAGVVASDSSITGTVADVTSVDQVSRFVTEAADAMGGIDVLISNAGISGPVAPVEDMDPEGWSRAIAVNLTGGFIVSQAAIPHLKASPCASIIFMSSLAGRYGYPDRSPYAASKWGLAGLTKTLSMELGAAGVTVNAILPGAVEGPRMRGILAERAEAAGSTPEAVAEALMGVQSIKRFVETDEIAALAIYLASPLARSISGQLIPMDGDSKALR